MNLQDATTFSALKEDLTSIIQQCVEGILAKATYHPKNVQTWVEDISAKVLERLRETNENFKYIVNTQIVEKNGAGMHSSTTAYWDSNTDGCVCHRWENKSMYCMVYVYGVAM